MGLFGKKEEKKKLSNTRFNSDMNLPKLPELPSLNLNNQREEIPQLPSFPSTSFGEKLSQDAIKDAVSGQKKGEGSWANELPKEGMSQEQKGLIEELEEPELKMPEIPSGFEDAAKIVKSNEPIFIRIDKFEESLKLFDKTKTNINEIEKLLKDIKRVKEEEEKELEFWNQEIQSIKNQIETIDKSIFSKIE